jgi:hypothetical protein
VSVNHGDVVGDDLSLYPDVKQLTGLTNCPAPFLPGMPVEPIQKFGRSWPGAKRSSPAKLNRGPWVGEPVVWQSARDHLHGPLILG